MSFSELKAQDNEKNLFKALSSVAFLAPVTAAPVETIVDATGAIKAFPAEYKSVGMITEDGITMSGDSSEEEVRAHGYLQAVRTDITESTREVTLTALEVFKENLLEVAYGVDLEAVTRDAVTGELTFDRPQLPENKHWRLVVLVKDGDNYQARFFPKVKLASVPEEVWNASDAQTFELAFRAEFDGALGTNERYFSVTKTA